MKYNNLLAETQKILPSARNILIALPSQASVDHLAAGLALHLALQQTQKEVSIVCDGPILVGHTNLFGIGEVKNRIPQSPSGNFILTLGGVANPQDSQKPVPSVEKMDYKAEGMDLKLIFNVVPGARFEPTFITPAYQGGSFEVVFVIGAANLNLLGSLYSTNSQVFSGVHMINIDNNQINSQFGTVNVVDPAACLSEIVAQILPGLALPIDGDIATNILTGIYSATNDLQSGNLGPDTFLMIAESLRAGGQKPSLSGQAAPVVQSVSAQAVSHSQSVQTPPPWMGGVSQEEQNRAFAQAFAPAATTGAEKPSESANQTVSSQEERPAGEGVTSEGEIIYPEPDWLTPKIFKGGLG